MSEENVEIVRQGIEAFNRGDPAALVAVLGPDFEYVPSGMIPDTDESYRGPDGFKKFSGWLSEFDDPWLEAHEFIDAGDHVVVSTTNRGRGKASGIETAWNVWLVWTFRDGRVVRGQGFPTEAEALRAVGLP